MKNVKRSKEQLEQHLLAYDKFLKSIENQTDSRRRFLRTLGAGMVGMSAIGGSFSCAPSSNSEAPMPPAPNSDLILDSRKFCIELPKSQYQSSQNSDKIIIETNGIPNHLVGIFPNLNCPCAIRSIEKKYSVDLNPQIVTQPRSLNGWLFGVAVNGVVFDPTGPFWSNVEDNVWEFDVMSSLARPYLGLDGSSAHVQPSGEYHYHGLPYSLISVLEYKAAGSRMLLLGVAADGFPIYAPLTHTNPEDQESPLRSVASSYRLKTGSRPSGGPKGSYDGTFVQDFEYISGLGDLDECNGRFSATPEFPGGIYHYFITAEFPFIPRSYRGAPDSSFAHNLPGPGAVPPALRSFGR